jgi:hypothetical protein
MGRVDLERVRDALNELESAEEQRRLWLATSGQIGSFDEVVSELFDYSGLGDVLDRPTTGGEISETAAVRIVQLGWALDAVDRSQAVAEMIESGAMQDVRRAAAVAREAMFGTASADAE